MEVAAIEIDDHVLEKIQVRHGVTLEEAEQVVYGPCRVLRGREGLYKAFGQSSAGRYLLVVLANKGHGVWKIVTARDMTFSEKRSYSKR